MGPFLAVRGSRFRVPRP